MGLKGIQLGIIIGVIVILVIAFLITALLVFLSDNLSVPEVSYDQTNGVFSITNSNLTQVYYILDISPPYRVPVSGPTETVSGQLSAGESIDINISILVDKGYLRPNARYGYLVAFADQSIYYYLSDTAYVNGIFTTPVASGVDLLKTYPMSELAARKETLSKNKI